jgi:predicted nucleic-acid-binding protein
MIAVDTNVLVRILTRDEPAQVRKALRRLRGQEVWLSKTVLLETEWVLRYSYVLSQSVVAHALQRLLGYPRARIEDRQAVVLALEGYLAGLDFADALHVASAGEADRFLTFDRTLARRAQGRTGRPPVEAL